MKQESSQLTTSFFESHSYFLIDWTFSIVITKVRYYPTISIDCYPCIRMFVWYGGFRNMAYLFEIYKQCSSLAIQSSFILGPKAVTLDTCLDWTVIEIDSFSLSIWFVQMNLQKEHTQKPTLYAFWKKKFQSSLFHMNKNYYKQQILGRNLH